MSDQPSPKKGYTNTQTILFMVILSLICALILSLLASILAKPQEIARELDRSKQMMIASKILSHDGYFLVQQSDGTYVPAKYTEGGILVPGTIHDYATNTQLIDIFQKRLKPMLTDDKGNVTTFEQAHIKLEDYVNDYKKTGYYKQPKKLFYAIMPNPTEPTKDAKPIGYVIPINGYGLWDAIYGYLAIEPDGKTVIGTTWYEQKETPGLGANIAEAYWQNLFPGKSIFQAAADGQVDLKLSPIGIAVVKGKVTEVLGNNPKALSAVDGMAGATLTGNGVTDAYRDSLAPYRALFININKEASKAQ